MTTHNINLPPLRRPQVPLIDADIDLADVRRLADWCEKTARSYARAAIESATAQLRQQLADTQAQLAEALSREEAIGAGGVSGKIHSPKIEAVPSTPEEEEAWTDLEKRVLFLERQLTPYGMIVRGARLMTGTTLYQMSQYCGHSSATLSGMETGRKPLDPAILSDVQRFFSSHGLVLSFQPALQSQDREDSDAWEWADANLVRAEAISDAQWEVENLISETFRGYTLREAIDHARRIEGEGERNE